MVDELQTLEVHCSGSSYCDYQVEGKKLSSDCLDYEEDEITRHNCYKGPSLASENSHLIVETVESELPSNSGEGESSPLEPKWLDQDETVALWVKWRGKWQAGIRCARADWPLSTLRAKPTHDRKKYFVIFFPHTKNYSWADMLLVRSINECPQPIAYSSHKVGLKMVRDLSAAHRFIMQKLAVGILNIIDQFHTDALTETARDVMVWKEFALEASRCIGYLELGKMLLKLRKMLLPCYMKSDWLEHSFESWAQRCQDARSAESIEMLKEELFDSIQWDEVNSLQNAPVQPTFNSEWKTWKHEVMKRFSFSHPMSTTGEIERSDDGFFTPSPQVSRKRAKLEVRRAEVHIAQVEPRGTDEAVAVEIDSEFFGNCGTVNAAILAPHHGKVEELKEGTAPTHSPSSVVHKWDEVVEAGKSELIQPKDVELTPVNGTVIRKPLDPGNKMRQCIAFIESKGRQCVRWANDGDVYCCVHLASRFLGSSAKAEGASSVDTPMCEGTTVLGTRCKHRSLQGSTFCKKHRPRIDTDRTTAVLENTYKRKHEEIMSSSANIYCKDIVPVGEVETAVDANPVSILRGDLFYGNSLIEKPGHSVGKDHNDTEIMYCIGSCSMDSSFHCLESPKRHSLYCEKHLPSWLKRARNGKSRIISKEVFMDLLKDCCSKEQKLCLHQACELFYRYLKSVLSLRNPVPMEVQLQWALSESSKDSGVWEFLMKLVSSEKERLKSIWGFGADEDAQGSSSIMEESNPLPLAITDGHDAEKTVRCKICLEEFLDDQVLGKHWMDDHKKEAQWLFRGYACSICLDSFTNKKVLESHVQERHHVQFVEHCMLLQCIPCGSHFGNTDELWSHVLSAHPLDFRLSTGAQQQTPIIEDSPRGSDLGNPTSMENKSENVGGFRRFVCRFCGLKFDLLPDLGRHHQAAHMGPNLLSSRPGKRGVRYYAYRLKSGRLSRPRIKKGLGAASYRMKNRSTANMRKCIQTTKSLSIEAMSIQPHVNEAASLGRLAEAHCSTVAKILFSEIQKAKPRPSNFEILSTARSACCKISLKASLEERYGVLPERLYLKAAKLCSEQNIQVNWHVEGFICPNGCTIVKEPLMLLPKEFVAHRSVHSPDSDHDEWEVDECHYVVDSHQFGQQGLEKAIILCDDISFGQETVPMPCVVDEVLLDSLHILLDATNGQSSASSMPWEKFTYVSRPLIDQSLALDTITLQLGCSCSNSKCFPESCDHVYLFDNDYEDAKDIFGKPMRGRFPYDDRGRIILEEGYLVYECNHMCNCSRNCPNRVLQNGVRVKLEIFRTEKKGWGIRASESIPRGTFVCELVGELIDETEANKRRNRDISDGCRYFYDVGAHINDMSRLMEAHTRYVIDSTNYGNVSRFINHSCSPNLTNYQVLVESMDCQLVHIGLYADRDIELGEELTYDYQYELLPEEGYPCHCEASRCRGRLY